MTGDLWLMEGHNAAHSCKRICRELDILSPRVFALVACVGYCYCPSLFPVIECRDTLTHPYGGNGAHSFLSLFLTLFEHV